MIDCKPFVKWAGGKGKLVNTIASSLPSNFSQLDNVTYIEPFVGGGAMLFWMLKNYPNIKRAIINDINPDLTTAYRVIKERPIELIERLYSIEQQYYSLNGEDEQRAFFLKNRTSFNEEILDDIERTSLFIFLNRTCFNGLYRVNKKGAFNVPFGKYSRPKICDEKTILANSEVLQKVEILTGDFAHTFDYATKQTLFYFDPPYKPISKSSNFTSYTKDGFNDDDQIRLGRFCEKIDDKGYSFVLSNSDVKSINVNDNFFDDIYENFNIERISVSRIINSKVEGRGKVSEILVSNINFNTPQYDGAF